MKQPLRHDTITNFIIDHREDSYRLAYSYVKNKEDAMDILQDAICKALSAESSLKDISAVKPWFFRILVNTAIDFLRKRKRTFYVEDETLDVLAGPKMDVYAELDLQKALEKLPTKDKTVILLRYFEGMRLQEIAVAMNENINTTKTRLYSSLRKLRLNMETPVESMKKECIR